MNYYTHRVKFFVEEKGLTVRQACGAVAADFAVEFETIFDIYLRDKYEGNVYPLEKRYQYEV
jgi:hypothetical protein